MALTAIGLSILTVYLDWTLGSKWSGQWEWLRATHPDGAREILSVIAGSMITVAGVTFSMTVVSVSFASSQFGPRLIGNFMRDKGNQFTLGTFIATFVYCLIVLRSVRSAEDISAQGPGVVESFVPHISLLIAIAFALASVAVLIYFIHHVPETINISNITAAIGTGLKKKIKRVFPEPEAESKCPPCTSPVDMKRRVAESVPIHSKSDCYLQSVNEAGLISLACQHDLMFRLEYRPGVFVAEGETLLLAWPPERMTEELHSKIRAQFSWNTDKTTSDGFLFLLDELIEMIAKALSPGVNDVFTAIDCSNWLKAGLIAASKRRPPDHLNYDKTGELRLVQQPMDFTFLADRIFGQTRAYMAADRNAALHEMRVLCDIGAAATANSHRDVLMKHANLLWEASKESLALKSDQQRLLTAFEATQKSLGRRDSSRWCRDPEGWLAQNQAHL